MNLKALLYTGCAVLATTSLFAETPSPINDTNTLSLEAAVSEVLSNNPSLKAARANWEAMRERVPQVRAWEDPKFEMDATAGRFVSVPPNSFADQKFMLEQALPLSGKNRLQGKAADADAAAAFEQLRRSELDAVRKARVAYYQLANAYAQLDVNRRNVDLLKQFVEISRDKFKTGGQSESDVLNAETALAKLEEDEADIQRQVLQAQIELNRLMNRPPETLLGHPGESTFQPVNLSLEKLEGLAIAHRPELFVAQEKIESAQARLEAARKEWIPDPGFRVEADRYNDAAQAISEVDAGFSVRLPWFNRKKYQAGIRENRKLLESAEEDLRAAREDALSLVQNQFIEVETFHHHTELYKDKLLPLAEQTANSKLSGYQSNKENFLDLLTAQQTVREVEAMYWDHLMHYRIGLAELESLVGTSLETATNSSVEHHHDLK
ncbi:MAG TPA: TolC family protein [Verrucomicrobiae bacterium]|nr:TolC family protein [Verrucomicrobiae bacterium]